MYSAVTLVVLRGVAGGGAGERLVVAPAVGHPGHGAGHRRRRGDHGGGDPGGCRRPRDRARRGVRAVAAGGRRRHARQPPAGQCRGQGWRAEPRGGCGRLATRWTIQRAVGAAQRRNRRSPYPDVRRDASREDPRDPRLPEARHPVLRHHDAPQGPGRLQGGDRPDAGAVPGRSGRPRRRDGVARVHLLRADGVPPGHGPRPGPQARQAARRRR